MAVREVEIRRRVIDRIRAHDEQQIHLAGVHFADQLLQGGSLLLRLGFDRIGVDHGVAGRAQRLIHGVRQCMHRRRLVVAGNHHRGATVRLQIFDQRGDKLLMLGFCRDSATNAQSRSDGSRQLLHLRSANRQAMIGFAGGVGWRALDGIEARHLFFQIGIAPAPQKTGRSTEIQETRWKGSRRRESE